VQVVCLRFSGYIISVAIYACSLKISRKRPQIIVKAEAEPFFYFKNCTCNEHDPAETTIENIYI